MLIDDVLPHYHVSEYHELAVSAPSERTYGAIWSADLATSLVVKGLLALRSIPVALSAPRSFRFPRVSLTLREILRQGFCLVAENPGREVVVGVVGRFWRPSGNIVPSQPGDFHEPLSAGLARAVWNFAVRERGPRSSLLSTETRVLCADDRSLRRFRRYWRLVGPLSGFVRVLMLRSIRVAAERVDEAE